MQTLGTVGRIANHLRTVIPSSCESRVSVEPDGFGAIAALDYFAGIARKKVLHRLPERSMVVHQEILLSAARCWEFTRHTASLREGNRVVNRGTRTNRPSTDTQTSGGFYS